MLGLLGAEVTPAPVVKCSSRAGGSFSRVPQSELSRGGAAARQRSAATSLSQLILLARAAERGCPVCHAGQRPSLCAVRPGGELGSRSPFPPRGPRGPAYPS